MGFYQPNKGRKKKRITGRVDRHRWLVSNVERGVFSVQKGLCQENVGGIVVGESHVIERVISGVNKQCEG